MEGLFLSLISGLSIKGNILSASLYRTGTGCTIDVEIDGEIYNFVIYKEAKTDGNGND